jgi:hypothetical protein
VLEAASAEYAFDAFGDPELVVVPLARVEHVTIDCGFELPKETP